MKSNNPFAIHGIKHLSHSSLNTWLQDPARFIADKLFGLRDKGSASMHRGTSVEFGLAQRYVDEDFQIYHEFMDKVLKNVEPETGKFQNEEFDFWIEINNSKGNKLFKVEFYNCRIESIGDIQLDSQDDAPEHTMSAEIKYDYYKTIRGTQAVPVISA